MSWRVTIDQIAGSGATQRYSAETGCDNLAIAVAYALVEAGLRTATVGEYQITATQTDAAIESEAR